MLAAKEVRPDRTPVVVKSGAVPPIISSEVWDQAALLRGKRAADRVPSRALTSDHLLTGIVRCMQCGHTMIGRKANPAPGAPTRERIQYYMCGGARLKGKVFCNCGYIRQEELDTWIVGRLKERYGGELGRQNYLAAIDAEVTQEMDQIRASLEQLRPEEAALSRELDVIARDYRRELMSYEEYREQRAQVERDRAALAEQMHSAERAMEALQRQAAARKSMAELVDQVPLWDSLSQAEKKHLLRELIADLRVYKPSRGQDLRYELTWVGGAEKVAVTLA